MDILVPEKLLNMLMMATPISILVVAIVQKFKSLSFIKNGNHIFVVNFIFSMTLGVLFSITFYETTWVEGLWISLLSFVGAPSIYGLLKKQNIVNYTPRSLTSNNDNQVISVPLENEIKRDGEK